MCFSQLKQHPSSQWHIGHHPATIPQRRNTQYIMKNINGRSLRNHKSNSHPGGLATLEEVSERGDAQPTTNFAPLQEAPQLKPND